MSAASGSGGRQLDIDELRNATERLSDQVSTLSLALQTVNYLQGEQQRIDGEMAETRAVAEEQRDLAGHLIGALDEKASTEELDRLRTLTRRVWVLFGGVVVAVVIALVGSYVANQHALHAGTRARLSICNQRNADMIVSSRASHAYFAPKLAAEKRNPHADPVLVSILQALATAPPQLLKCR